MSLEKFLNSEEIKKFKAVKTIFEYSINKYNINANQIIDCCSGNGFFGLDLLSNNFKYEVLAIDIERTKKARKIYDYFKKNNPVKVQKYRFKKIDILKEKFPKINNGLIVGIHTCGILTDKIIEVSVKQNTPFIILPCCYNKNRHYFENSGQFYENAEESIHMNRINYLIKNNVHIEENIIKTIKAPMNKALIGILKTSNQ
ncbi:SAM-dependent methyltransferase [Candidatus Woesearchaeota archaeon]|nr:SAM-dependent methyltransferase [Candidatus Woesearchaeota archaeon]